MDEPRDLSVIEAKRRIMSGTLTSVELVQSCLERIDETEGEIKAWAHLDPAYALAQAAKLDDIRRRGKPLGSLHGIPIGLKDVIDTKDQPTERGTPIFAGRRPDHDAAVVERLMDAGAVIMGKTVTTELAFLHPSQTRNPRNTHHSPGGSSSGSAAAVAARHVPLAIGTQTNGSVIRPASFCGVFGFKPTRGIISRRGVLQTSKSLDQIGAFGRNLDDVALLCDALAAYDPRDRASYARPRPSMLGGFRTDLSSEPRFLVLDLPYADLLSDGVKKGLDAFAKTLGGRVQHAPSPPELTGLINAQNTIHEYEICQHLSDTFHEHWDLLSPTLQPTVERGRAIPEATYRSALEAMAKANALFDELFENFDAILAPSAPGEAPLFGTGTGNPICSTIWTLAGLPCLTLPFLAGSSGLPIGLQLIGPAENDGKLLSLGNWMIERAKQNKLEEIEVTA